mgnify:CR=1 FL=1
MDSVGTVRSIVKFDVLSLREQLHCKVCGGECMQLYTAVPHFHVYGFYRCKLNNIIVGEKHCAKNCLIVSNYKFDDVFSDVFKNAASRITSYFWGHPNGLLTDVSQFRAKGM